MESRCPCIGDDSSVSLSRCCEEALCKHCIDVNPQAAILNVAVMKTTPRGRPLLVIPTILAASVVGMNSVQADSLNETKILRKAGGRVEGTLKQIFVTKFHPGGLVETVQAFDRSGTAKIPTSEGKAKSTIKPTESSTDTFGGFSTVKFGRPFRAEFGAPAQSLDTKTQGTVKKADVKRDGKTIKYKAKGQAEILQTVDTIDFSDPLRGNLKATSKIRGKNVVTSANLTGSRASDDGLVGQKVTAVAKGKGKY